MSKRKPVKKSIRFDVFRRDNFTCLYCGRSAPDVVLEIDHMHPVSKGGENDTDNLVTSCCDCNRGKSNKLLAEVPPSLSERAEMEKEKRAQIEAYGKALAQAKKAIQKDIRKVEKVFQKTFPDSEFSAGFRISLSNFLQRKTYYDLMDYMEIATARVSDDPGGALKYFCGIYWNRITQDRCNA